MGWVGGLLEVWKGDEGGMGMVRQYEGGRGGSSSSSSSMDRRMSYNDFSRAADKVWAPALAVSSGVSALFDRMGTGGDADIVLSEFLKWLCCTKVARVALYEMLSAEAADAKTSIMRGTSSGLEATTSTASPRSSSTFSD